MVRWGSTSGTYTSTVSGSSFTYGVKDMCGEPATSIGFRNPGTFHSAVIAGLAWNQTIYYTFGDAEAGGFSQEFSVTARLGVCVCVKGEREREREIIHTLTHSHKQDGALQFV